MVRAATTTSSIEAEQDSGNITKTQSKATPNEPGSQGTRVNTPRSDDDSLKLKELMELCTNLEKTKTSQAQEITSLKRKIKRLEKKGELRTHKLKRLYKIGSKAMVASSGEESLGEKDASKQYRKIDDIDADEGVTLVDEIVEDQGRFNDEEMFDAGVLDGEEVVSTTKVSTAGIEVTTASATTMIANDLTL
ncbi:hypothetical protein Tco_0182388, partial [Tanacetum coccineum]